MEKIKETNYHADWQKNRVNFILNKYPKGYFKGKRILELGSFNGYIGAYFNSLGAEVHCIEGRTENVLNIKKDYPQLSVESSNLDRPDWIWGSWDVIINFGLYYHLENYHLEHLTNCIDNTKILFFETVIFDSDEPEIYYRNESGIDQSLGETGGNPTTSYVENIFSGKNTLYRKYCDSSLNGGLHKYDWVDSNTKLLDQYTRRFWVVHNLSNF